MCWYSLDSEGTDYKKQTQTDKGCSYQVGLFLRISDTIESSLSVFRCVWLGIVS